MKFDDYRLADCTLFRLPPIDVSELQDTIELALVKAWEQGYSADSAVDAVLGNKTVLDTLVDQVADNLKFQQATAAKQTEAEARENINAYKAEKQQELATVQQKLGAEEAEKQRKAAEAKVSLEQKTATYNAAQARLEELRARVRARMKELGGEDKYQALLDINQQVVSTTLEKPTSAKAGSSEADTYTPASASEAKPGDHSSHNKKEYVAKKTEYILKESADLKPGLKLGESTPTLEEKITEKPLEKQDSAATSPLETKPTKYGPSRRFFRKVWQVLSYKIW